MFTRLCLYMLCLKMSTELCLGNSYSLKNGTTMVAILTHLPSLFTILPIIRSEIAHICRRYNILALCLLHWVHVLHIRYVTCVSPLVC